MTRTYLFVLAIAISVGAFFWLRVSPPEITPSPIVKATPEPAPAVKAPKQSEVKPVAAPTRVSHLGPFAEQLKSLPRKEEIKKLSPEQLHHGPPGLANSAKALGEVMARLKSDPAQLPAAVAFYEHCASDSEILTSVRAVCFRNLKHFGRGINPSSYPEDVVRISESLPPIQ